VKRVSRLPVPSKCLVETLETRRLLSVALQPLSNLLLPQGSPAQTVDLSQIFGDNTTGVNDLTFTAKSDNTSLAQATVSGSELTINLAPTASGFAHISIQGTAPDGSSASQNFRLQVTASPDRTLTVPIGTPGHSTFRFVEANHTIGQITLTGPGTGTITLGGDKLSLAGTQARGANQELESIDLTGTTSATHLSISGVEASRGRVVADIGNITSDGSLGSLGIQKVDLVGDVTLAGGINSINIAAAQNSSLTFSQSTGPIAMTVGALNDVTVSTPAPFGLIKGGDWVSTDSVPESFHAAYIGRVYMTGNFDVGVQLTGTGAPGRTLGKLTVRGVIGGTWTIPGSSAPFLIGGTTSDWDATINSIPNINDLGSMGGSLTTPSLSYLKVHGNMVGALVDLTGTTGTDLGAMHVFGVIRSSAIESAANLGPIACESLEATIVYAGVSQLPQGQVLPAAASDLSSSATIESITIRPRGKVTIGFQASDIAAAMLGNLALATTEVNNNGVTFGLAAESIGHVSVRDLTHRRQLNLHDVHDAATLAAQIAASSFTTQDLSLTILS
jgi:hypothetical protein